MTNGWLLNEKVMEALSDKDYKIIEKIHLDLQH